MRSPYRVTSVAAELVATSASPAPSAQRRPRIRMKEAAGKMAEPAARWAVAEECAGEGKTGPAMPRRSAESARAEPAPPALSVLPAVTVGHEPVASCQGTMFGDALFHFAARNGVERIPGSRWIVYDDFRQLDVAVRKGKIVRVAVVVFPRVLRCRRRFRRGRWWRRQKRAGAQRAARRGPRLGAAVQASSMLASGGLWSGAKPP